ncbi:MAG: DUF2169 domain-containing protein [Sandaracinaceae bacterium]|nr:DUF2169 domain-containing protein [Sandaracinaceae bacterium]
MDLLTFGPVVAYVFPTRDARNLDHYVVVAKATFDLRSGEPTDDPEPIHTTAVAFGDLHTTSLRMDDDLAPIKPNADIWVDATARAPRGKPSQRWDVRMRIGALERRLAITGPRAWVKTVLGYELSDPQPALEVPLRYERAFGGVAGDAVCEGNPIGTGFVADRDRPDVVIAPQIESPEDPIGAIGRVHAPCGTLPLHRSWLPRRAQAGTFDARWRETRSPRLPEDFSPAFYNAAHPDFVYDGYLRGDETIELAGVAERTLSFRLPGCVTSVTTRPASALSPLLLDTLFVDADGARAVMTWRCSFPMERPVGVVAVHVRRG